MPQQPIVESPPMGHRYLFIGVVLILVLACVGRLSSRETGDDNQGGRVRFSHRFHVKDTGIACVNCHGRAAASTKASDNLLATMVTCKPCHDAAIKGACTFCHVGADSTSYSNTPNPVRKIHFSHQDHIQEFGTACETCHSSLEGEKSTGGELVPSMSSCVPCHNNQRASGECEECHAHKETPRREQHEKKDRD
jgi:hypothetical protein